MKTHYFIIFLFFIFCQSCKKDLPKSATTITGKVVDENNLPIEGVSFYFGGYHQSGVSGYPTFDVYGQTDKNGVYFLSIVVPNATDVSLLQINNSDKFNFDTVYKIFLQKDNNYVEFSEELMISNYGQALTYNFQIRKR